MKIDFTYDDIITGEKFQSLADFEYLPNKELPQKDCIIYCKTDYLKFCVPLIEKSENTFVLISHNSDGNIVRENPREFDFLFTQFPKQIKTWYAQNVVGISHENLIPLMIGLENNYNYLADYKKQLILQKIQSGEIFRKREKLLYINHNIETNPSERKKPYELFKTDSDYTVEYGKNGSGFENYLNQILNHKFILSPIAHGWDSHRIWESLLLGSIPIVKTNTFNFEITNMFNMCEVSDWENITKEKLEDFYNQINKPEYIEKRYNYLKFDYWKKLITNN